MDFFNRAYSSAKEQAAKAAAQAEVYAEQAQAAARLAAERASKAAEQAQSAARLQAEEASKKLQSMQTDMKTLNLDTASIKVWAGMGGSKSVEEERMEYGLSPEYLENVASFNYAVFMDFPEERLEITRSLTPQQMPRTMRLGPWQERHAVLLTQALPAFNDLRAVLTPKKMPEERFWEIYFTLGRDKLPKGAMQFHLLNGDTPSAGDAAAAAAFCSSPSGAMGFSLGDEDEEDEDAADAESADGWGADADDVDGWGNWAAMNGGAAAASVAAANEGDGQEDQAGGSGAAGAADASTDGTQQQQQQEPDGAEAASDLTAENDEEPSQELSVHDSEDLLDDDGDGDDDFDAYVEGMLAGSDDDDEGGDDEDGEDDFDAYLDGLAKETGGDGEDDDDDDDDDLEDLLGEDDEDDEES